MPGKNFLSNILKEAPPAFIFELSESGIAVARTANPPQINFRPVQPDVISVSPIKDNVLDPDALAAHVKALVPADANRKRRKAVVILPDCGIRITVLDFDAFPSDPGEQLSLVRFRVKKTLPFDLDSAALSYFAQGNGASKRRDVVVAAAPIETVARYEAPFRAAGLQPGLVTTSTLSALHLVRAQGMVVLVKLTGRILTISVVDHGALKLLRCIEVGDFSAAEVSAQLHPTFAYTEDQLEGKPDSLLVCGFGALTQTLRDEFQQEFGIPVEPLRSNFGIPDQNNAGLMGHLQAMEESS